MPLFNFSFPSIQLYNLTFYILIQNSYNKSCKIAKLFPQFSIITDNLLGKLLSKIILPFVFKSVFLNLPLSLVILFESNISILTTQFNFSQVSSPLYLIYYIHKSKRRLMVNYLKITFSWRWSGLTILIKMLLCFLLN